MGRVSETCGTRFLSFVPSEAPEDRLDRHIGYTVGGARRADLKERTLGMRPTERNNRLYRRTDIFVVCLRAEYRNCLPICTDSDGIGANVQAVIEVTDTRISHEAVMS